MKKSALTILKELFFDYDARLAAELAHSVEGELKIEEVVIGAPVQVITTDGSLAVAPDGEHKYGEDTLTVEGGKIAAINGERGDDTQDEKPAKEEGFEAAEEVVAEEVTVEEVIEETPAEVAETVTEVEVLPNPEIEALKAENASLKEQLAELSNKTEGFATKEQFQALQAQVEDSVDKWTKALQKFSGMPAETSRTTNTSIVNDAVKRKRNEFAALLNPGK